MSHPSVTALLGDRLDPEVEAHVASCASCRTLVAHAAPVARAAELLELPVIDPAVFTRSDAPQRGGMGKVVVAHDRRLGRDVVLKQPLGPDDVPDPVLRATLGIRFEREARLTARLEHPAIVGVYEAGRFPDGQPFYAMRLVRGEALGDQLAKRPTLAERITLLPALTMIAEALAYAHSRGIVHRDVKPANIVVGEFGGCTLIDWGLAAELGGREPADTTSYRRAELPLTEYGVGTPGYMAPEQAAGEAAATPADVYAFGATLFHVLAGVAPGSAPLAEVCPDAPAPLIALVMRAMAERPAERIDAPTLVAELRRFQTGQLLTSHRYTARELLVHVVRRYRVPLAIAAIAVVAVAVLTIFYVRGLARETERTEAARRDAELALRRQLGVSASQLARDPLLRLEALAAGTAAVAPDVAATPAPEAWQGLLDALAMGPAVVPLIGHRGAVSALAPIDDERLITSGDHDVRLWRLPDGAPLGDIASQITRAQQIVVSPDHRHAVICGYDARAELVQLAPLAVRTLELGVGDARCAFTADGLAIVSAGNELRAFDPATGKTTATATLAAPVTALAADREVVAGTQRGEVAVWTVTNAPVVTPAHPGGVRVIALDGARWITAGVDGKVVAWPREPGGLGTPTTLYAGPAPIQDLDRVPAGIVALAAPNLVDQSSLTTMIFGGPDSPTTLTGFAFAHGARVARDRIAVYAPERVRLADPLTGRDLLELPMPGRINVVAHAGDQVIAASTSGPVVMVDIRGGDWRFGHTSEISRLQANDGGLASSSFDGTLRRWATDGSSQATVLASEVLDLVATEQRLLAVRRDGAIEVIERAGTRRTLSIPGRDLGFVAVSPDGATAVTAGEPGTAQLWELATGAPIATSSTSPRSTAAVTAAVFDRDGAIVVGTADGIVTRFSGGQPVRGIQLSEPAAVTRLELTGEGLAIGLSTARTELVDPVTLVVRGTADGRLAGQHAGLPVIAFVDGRIELGIRAPRRLDGHLQPVHAITSRGELFASADIGGVVRVWRGDRELARFSPIGLGSPTALAFVDDTTLAIGGRTGALRVLPFTPAAAVAYACSLLRHFGRACSS